MTIERQQCNTGFRASHIGTAQRQGTYSYDYNSPIPNDQPYVDKARPFPQYPGIPYRTNGAGHQYNSLSTEVKRSMAKGLQARLAWTWARDRYDLSRWDSLENPFDRHREVAVAPDVPRVGEPFFRGGSQETRQAELEEPASARGAGPRRPAGMATNRP